MIVWLAFIFALFLLALALGAVMHLINTIGQLRQYIGELERDLYNLRNSVEEFNGYKSYLKHGNYDNRTTDHQ